MAGSALELPVAAPAASEPVADEPVYVWELPVRLVHWGIVLSIAVLAVTGLYIHAPFIAPPPNEAAPSIMATVRFVHEIFAIIFSISVAVRVYWAFAGNRYAHWRALVPHTRAQWRAVGEMLRYYTFRRREPPPAVGHNSLAALFYLIVYAGFAAQVLSGLLLFAWVLSTGPVSLLFGWVSLVPGGIQVVRLFHYVLTFAFLAFTIHHVYSAVLIDSEERSGLLSSIVTGFKRVPREWLKTDDGERHSEPHADA